MNRDPRLYVEDILYSINSIEQYVSSLSEEEFYRNEMLQDAVVRRLEIIGEAARNLPAELRRQYPDIPWRRIIGLRNIISHEYFRTVLSRIWEVIQRDIPHLKARVAEIRQELG